MDIARWVSSCEAFQQNAADCKTINGVNCVTVEPDIDYYSDLGAHALLEVIPNALTHSLTNPIEVYIRDGSQAATQVSRVRTAL